MGAPDEKIRKIVAQQLEVSLDKVTADARFVEDLGADSLDQVELIMSLEEEFGTNIPDDDAEKLLTVGEVIKYVETRQWK